MYQKIEWVTLHRFFCVKRWWLFSARSVNFYNWTPAMYWLQWYYPFYVWHFPRVFLSRADVLNDMTTSSISKTFSYITPTSDFGCGYSQGAFLAKSSRSFSFGSGSHSSICSNLWYCLSVIVILSGSVFRKKSNNSLSLSVMVLHPISASGRVLPNRIICLTSVLVTLRTMMWVNQNAWKVSAPDD